MHNIEHYNYPADANKANIEKELNEYVSVVTRLEGGNGLPSKIRWLNHTCESREEALEYIKADEYVEITPNHLRMRKIVLDELERKRIAKASGAED